MPPDGSGRRRCVQGTPCLVVSGGLCWEVAAGYRDVLLGPDGLRLGEWLAAGQARVIKHGPHRTVYRVVLPEVDCYVKHCRVQDGRAWLRECVRPAKARGEYDRCRAVAERGVSTVIPLAVGVRRGGGPGDSFLITRAIDAEPLGTFLEQQLPEFDAQRAIGLRQRMRGRPGAVPGAACTRWGSYTATCTPTTCFCRWAPTTSRACS